ncbi:hypothetical protein AB0I04_55085, partial [Actinoallomurus sp. NPDC050550]
LINPTRPGEYNLTPFTGPNPADPPTLTPDLQTTQNPGTTDTPNPGALPDLGTEARALIITPDGRSHTPTPTPAPTARALTDPTHPHTGAPRKRGPDTWNAPTPPTPGARPTDQQLQQFAQDARDANVSSGSIFLTGLFAARWGGIGGGQQARVWQAWNAVTKATRVAAPAEVPAWVARPSQYGDTPTDQQLQQFASAARQAGVSNGNAFVAGLTAAGWEGLRQGYARAREAWNAAPPAAAPAAVPAWATLPPQHGDTPTDQQLQQFAQDARQAGVSNGDAFVTGLTAVGWRSLGHRYARAREAWNADPAATPAAVPAWATRPPQHGDTPTDQQLQQFAQDARQAGVSNGNAFVTGLTAVGWRSLGHRYARAREAWNADPAATPAAVPAWATRPPQHGDKPTDQQLQQFAQDARQAGVRSGNAFVAGLFDAGWRSLGQAGARARETLNAVQPAAPAAAPTSVTRPPQHGDTPTDQQLQQFASAAEVPAWVTRPPQHGDTPTDQQLQQFAQDARQAGVRNGNVFAAGLAAAGWRGLGFWYARAWQTWNAAPLAAAPVEVPAWVTLPPRRDATPTYEQLQRFAHDARQAGVINGKVFVAGLAAAGWKGLGDGRARARAAWNAVTEEAPLGHGATPTDRQGEVIMPDRPPRPGTAFSPPTFDSQPSDSHQFDPPYRTDGMAPVD